MLPPMAFRRKIAFLMLLWSVLLATGELCVQAQASSAEVLTNAAEILALSAEQALKPYSVLIKGVVTVAEPYWEGRFFVQDATAGIFVDNFSPYQPRPGDVVEVAGVSD